MLITDLITPDAERSAADGEGRQWYTLDPETVYPWALDQIAAAIAAGHAGGITPQLLARAQAVPVAAWAAARLARDAVAAGDVAARAEALEVARLWATERLHAAVGYAPVGLHILKRPAWRM